MPKRQRNPPGAGTNGTPQDWNVQSKCHFPHQNQEQKGKGTGGLKVLWAMTQGQVCGQAGTQLNGLKLRLEQMPELKLGGALVPGLWAKVSQGHEGGVACEKGWRVSLCQGR